MNMVDFQEKMDPTHRIYLCRMLNVKELPEDLLERYAQVKRLVDRIDGHLTPGDLAMIAISSVETTTTTSSGPPTTSTPSTPVKEQSVEPPALDASDDKVIEEAVESPFETIVESPVEPSYEPPVSGATEQAAEKPAPKEGKAMLWSPGMPVNVLIEDELKTGKIFAVHPPGDGQEQVQLTVEFDGGETVMVDEDEVEAV